MTNRIRVVQGDITRMQVDAIVNAANSSLLGGGGVDGAIHRAAGAELLAACKAWVAKHGQCATGEAVITAAGRLPVRAVIHTVGPVWYGGTRNEPALLANAYRNSLKLAAENSIGSLAFPAISTGVYGYPAREAAQVAFATVNAFLTAHRLPEQVWFVCFGEETFGLYQKLLAEQQHSEKSYDNPWSQGE